MSSWTCPGSRAAARSSSSITSTSGRWRRERPSGCASSPSAFSPDGGVVTISASRHDDDLRIAVEDHGLGIPKAAQDRVFERFYKVDRARQRPEVGGGTGLGLAIARHVVEQHGGRIGVTSVEGQGSTFFVDLPISAAVPA
jgi:signal transduction histidine kinase